MLLVTGASGLLGATLVLTAQAAGHEVTGTFNRHRMQVPGTRMLKVNLADEMALRNAVTSIQPRVIIHCAAATNVDGCEEHEPDAVKMNVNSSSVLAEIAARTGARMMYVSTDAVFDGQRGGYLETDEPNPINVYARTKLEGERAVTGQCPSAIVRINTFGWSPQRKPSLAEWMLSQLEQGKQLAGFEDVWFCPVLVNELAEILLTMVAGNLSGIYHVVGAETISKFEFGQRLAATFGFDPGRVVPTRVAASALKAPRPRNMSLRTGKIERALGQSMPDVQSGLETFRQLRESGYERRLKSYLVGEA